MIEQQLLPNTTGKRSYIAPILIIAYIKLEMTNNQYEIIS